MKIGLLGLGNVGRGVWEHLFDDDKLSIKKVLVRRPRPELGDKVVHTFDEILTDPEIDTVVELIGGIHPAYEYVKQALEAGKHVVTANKLMLSYHFEELCEICSRTGSKLLIDASVGGGIPYLFNVMRSGAVDPIQSVYGIVNGTTNLILDTMQNSDIDFSDVLAQAQAAGYAEADPSADIDGIDARSKLCVMADLAFGCVVSPESIATEGIRFISKEDIHAFKAMGLVCRLIVNAEKHSDSALSAYVEPTLVAADSIESAVHKNNNVIGFTAQYVGSQYFYGQGAGTDPTANAVVLGLRALANGDAHSVSLNGSIAVDNSSVLRSYYLRTSAEITIDADPLDTICDIPVYITKPVSVEEMHRQAAIMRKTDPELFFAGIRDDNILSK